jgi:hypothetical protein
MQKGGSRINKWLNGKVESSCAYFAHASVRIEIQIGFQRFPRERRQLHQLLVQEQDPGHKLSNHFTSFQLAKIFRSRPYLIGTFQDRGHEQDFAKLSHFLGKRLDL